MNLPICGSSNRRRWSVVLYFQLCRGEHGDELQIFVGERIHRWWIPGRLSLALGDRQVALEEPTTWGTEKSAGPPTWDAGFCHVPGFEMAAATGFEQAWRSGNVVIALAGTEVWGTFHLVRQQSGKVAEQWLIWRSSTIEQVA